MTFAAATQDHWLWSWKTQFHSCLGNWLRQTDYKQTRALRSLTVGLPSKPSGCPPHGRANRVNAGDCIIPLVGEASLWTSTVIAQYLLHGRVLRTIVESESTVRLSMNLQHHCILLLFEAILFSVIRKYFSLSRTLSRNLMFGKDKCMHAKLLHSCSTLCNPVDCSPPGSSVHGDSPGKNTRVGCHALLQGIFLAQGLNPHLSHLLHWQKVL